MLVVAPPTAGVFHNVLRSVAVMAMVTAVNGAAEANAADADCDLYL